MNFEKKEIKLFTISGKARSGKGEIAKIISSYYSDKKVICISFGHYIKDYAKRITNWDGSEDTKPREFLQQFGIELVKDKIDDKLFIRRVLEDIVIFSYFYDIIIVDDVRLLDELSILRDNYPNLVSIKVVRNSFNDNLTDSEKKHRTEVDLDNYSNFNYIIKNDSYGNLKEQIYSALNEVKL